MYQTLNESPRQLRIRLLTSDDLSFAETLREIAGWNQTRGYWQRLIDYEPHGCFLALWDDQPVGTVTTTTYGSALGWIGMMLVHPDFRRRGIATALMQQAMDYLTRHKVRCIKLDATPAGQPVYERLGFQAEWGFQRWQRGVGESVAPLAGDAPLLPAGIEVGERARQLGRIRDMDCQAFGADRMRWLEALAGESTTIVEQGGYAMLRLGMLAGYLGPVVAESPEAAATLVRQLTDSWRGPLFWDVPGPNREGVELARSLGFAPCRTLLRMWTGEALVDGNVRQQFAIGDPATG